MTDRVEPWRQGTRPLAGVSAAALDRRGRSLLIMVILLLALLAFEVFNFDTTRYALTALLGDVRFGGVRWATILAVAFCGIDFAGLLRVFAPDAPVEGNTPAVWYLMAAWLLGATMNAVMTWYAVSLTLMQHEIGNELLSRQQLLTLVPIFVAALVWLTRILFIGALSLAGGELFDRAPAAPVAPGEGGSAPAAPRATPTQRATPATLRPLTAASARRSPPRDGA